jgi:hypothetical protein
MAMACRVLSLSPLYVVPLPNRTPLAMRTATSARPSLSKSYTVTPSL